jgi:NADH-quinone oxidoreductase subunit H
VAELSLTSVVARILTTAGLPAAWAGTVTAVMAALILLFLWIMPVVTYMIWWLRRVIAFMQSRLGPNRVGWEGLLQTPADAVKLISKEDVIPTLADRWVFKLAPFLVFVPAFIVYVTVPFGPTLVAQDLAIGVLYATAVMSVSVLGIILAAWASNNKYALISAFRSAAQMVSYEVPLAIALLGPVLLTGALSFRAIVLEQSRGFGFLEGLGFLGWFACLQPILFLCFLIAALAENNVTPFDIVEAESELVAGYHVEYSGMKFALFFLAEFANTFTVAALTTLLFLGGWLSPFPAATAAGGSFLLGLLPRGDLFDLVRAVLVQLVSPFFWFVAKAFALVTVVFWIRATLPRVRVDQLMDFGWKALIPITLAGVLIAGMWVALGWPTLTLAAVNWAILLGVLALGATKRLPTVSRVAVPSTGSLEPGARA